MCLRRATLNPEQAPLQADGQKDRRNRDNYYSRDYNCLDRSTGVSRRQRFGDRDEPHDEPREGTELDSNLFLAALIDKQGHQGKLRQMLGCLQTYVRNGIMHLCLDSTDTKPVMVRMYPDPAANIHWASECDDRFEAMVSEGGDMTDPDQIPTWSYPEGHMLHALAKQFEGSSTLARGTQHSDPTVSDTDLDSDTDIGFRLLGRGISHSDRAKVYGMRDMLLGPDERAARPSPQTDSLSPPTASSTSSDTDETVDSDSSDMDGRASDG